MLPERYNVRDGLPERYNVLEVLLECYNVREVLPECYNVREVLPECYNVNNTKFFTHALFTVRACLLDARNATAIYSVVCGEASKNETYTSSKNELGRYFIITS